MIQAELSSAAACALAKEHPEPEHPPDHLIKRQMENLRATLHAGQLEHCIGVLDARYAMLPLIGVCKAA